MVVSEHDGKGRF